MGIGEIKTNYHRPFTGEPKAITVKREGTKWWLHVRCVNVSAKPLEPTSCEIGIDLGVVNQLATSDGELKKGKHFDAKAHEILARASVNSRLSNEGRIVVDVRLKRSCDCTSRSRISGAMQPTN